MGKILLKTNKKESGMNCIQREILLETVSSGGKRCPEK
jgi:hypothetical protein